MGRRKGRMGIVARVLLIGGAVGTIASLFIPWFEISPDLLGPMGDVFAWIAGIESEPVAGYEIPALVRRTGESDTLQGLIALDELFSGRLDLLTARLIFGERYEEEWAPAVYLPSLAALASLLLLAFPGRRFLAAAVCVVDVQILALATWATWSIRFDQGTNLKLHAGVFLTLAGLTVVTAGAWRASAPAPRRRRGRRRAKA